MWTTVLASCLGNMLPNPSIEQKASSNFMDNKMEHYEKPEN